MPAKKKSRANPAGKMSKAAFVRSYPLGTSADLIVEEGKAQGLELTRNFVWTTHSDVRRGLRREQGDAQKILRDLILELGVARADLLYHHVRAELIADAKAKV